MAHESCCSLHCSSERALQSTGTPAAAALLWSEAGSSGADAGGAAQVKTYGDLRERLVEQEGGWGAGTSRRSTTACGTTPPDLALKPS